MRLRGIIGILWGDIMEEYTLTDVCASVLQPFLSLINSVETDTVLLEFEDNTITIRALPYYRTILFLAELQKRSFVKDFQILSENKSQGEKLSKVIIVNPKYLYKYIERVAEGSKQITFAYNEKQRKLKLTFYFKNKKFDAFIPTLTTKPSDYEWLIQKSIEKPKEYMAVPREELVNILTLFYNVKATIIEINSKQNILEVNGFSELDMVRTTLQLVEVNNMEFNKVKIRFEGNFMKELYQLFGKLNTKKVYLSYKNNTINFYSEGVLEQNLAKIYITIPESI